MSMVFCRGCAAEIHETASTCPKCGAPQMKTSATPPAPVATARPHWLPIVSLVLEVFCVLMLFDDSGWDKDEITGFGMFAVAGLVVAVVSLAKGLPGRRTGIAAVVLGVINMLALLGLVSK